MFICQETLAVPLMGQVMFEWAAGLFGRCLCPLAVYSLFLCTVGAS